MPYREKIAWLSLAAIAVTFGPYFAIVASGRLDGAPLPNLPQLWLFAGAAIAQALIIGAGHLVLRRSAPEDARMPLDERDRTIALRSLKAAYLVLVAGMIVVGVVMPFQSVGWKIINAAIFMLVIAELVHYGIVAASYRRQS